MYAYRHVYTRTYICMCVCVRVLMLYVHTHAYVCVVAVHAFVSAYTNGIRHTYIDVHMYIHVYAGRWCK